MVLISLNEFLRAVKKENSGYTNTNDYNLFEKSLKYAGITTHKEAALFLAHIIHETGGLAKMKEDGVERFRKKDIEKYSKNSILFDGYPRKIDQAHFLDDIIAETNESFNDSHQQE